MCRRHLALALSLWPFLGCGDADRGTHDAVDTTPGDTAEIADTAVDTTPQDVTPETQDVAPDTPDAVESPLLAEAQAEGGLA